MRRPSRASHSQEPVKYLVDVVNPSSQPLEKLKSVRNDLRSAGIRVVAGAMLLASAIAGLATLNVDLSKPNTLTDAACCVLGSSICYVAFYHYCQLMTLRSQPHSEEIELKCDAIRYSDWIITLPALVIELHLTTRPTNTKEAIHDSGYNIIWVLCMILCGGITRFGFDELKGNSLPFKIVGGVIFCLGCVFLGIIMEDLDIGNHMAEIGLFVIPWSFYGAMAIVCIAWRNVDQSEYPELLSIIKDLVYGLLDIHCKALFAIVATAKLYKFF